MMFRPLYHFLSFLPSSWLMVMHTYLLVMTTAVRGRADRHRQTGMRQTGEKCNYRVQVTNMAVLVVGLSARWVPAHKLWVLAPWALKGVALCYCPPASIR